MATRYTVRASEDGFGVWDVEVHGWRSQQGLTRSEAERLAAQLAGTPAGDIRVVDPPRRVEIFADGAWWPGELDGWQRRPDGWYGRAARDVTGHADWYPAGQLRPAPPP